MPDKPKTFSGDEVVVFGSTTPPSTPPDLRILHFNDVYHLDPSSAEPMGGAARFQTLVDYYRFDPRFEGQPELLVFFSGDAFNPSLESSVTKGTHMVPVLNEIGVDVACVGNHDLDFGVQQFAHLIKQCEFPWLLANVLDKDLGKDVPLGGVGRTLVLPVTDGDGTEVQNNAVKVGVIGLGEREWLATLNNIPPGTEYRSATATARELVPKLTLPLAEGGGGAKFVIALTHMREPNDVKLAENCSDIIDLVLGGHDHYYNHQVVGSRGTHVLRSGSDFKDLSYIEVRRKTPGGSEQQQGTGTTKGSNPNWDVRVIRRSLVSAIPENKETARLVDSLTSSLKQSLNKPIGWTLSPLDARFVTVRRKESNLGNFVCDIMRHHYAYLDSDCAIMAGGTIRGDQIYPPGAIRVKDITDCFPFEDPVVVLRATGQCIWDALENGVSLYPALEGRFPQVSGISFVFDPEQPPGKRIVEVKMNGKPLELERKYVVVTRGYMARGKDGFTSLLTQEHGGPTEELVSEENGPLISMLLRQYFMALKTFDKWKHSSPSMDKQWSKIVSSVAETHPTMEPAKVQEPAAALPPPAVGVTFKPCYNEGGDSEKQGGAENKSMAKWENWTAHKVRQRQASLRPFDETSDASSAPRRPSTTLLRKRSSSKGDTTAAARAAALVQQEMSAPMSSLAVVDESPYDERSQPQHEESQEAKDLRLFDEQKRLMRKYMAKWMRIVGVTPKACDEITPEEAADVDWTRAVAPRVEGRIRNVRAKPEEG